MISVHLAGWIFFGCQLAGRGEVNSSTRRNHYKRQRSLIVKHKRSRILMTGHDDYGLLCKKLGGSTLTCSTIENCTKAWRLIELMLTPLSRCIWTPRSQLPAPWVLRCLGNVSLWPFEPLLSPAFIFDNWMSIQVDNDICMMMISFYRPSESLSCTILYLLVTYLRISNSIMGYFSGFVLYIAPLEWKNQFERLVMHVAYLSYSFGVNGQIISLRIQNMSLIVLISGELK